MTGRRAIGASGRAPGFTLVEVVMAIGIVTAVMIPMVILLGHGLDHAGDITSRDRALRLVPAIEQRLNAVDFSESRGWAQTGGRLFAYVYRGDPASGNAAGGPGSATTGNDVFIAVARSARESGAISAEVGSIEGNMFRVDLSPAPPTSRALREARMPERNANAASVELDARISRVLTAPKWQTSAVEPRLTLRFVINR